MQPKNTPTLDDNHNLRPQPVFFYYWCNLIQKMAIDDGCNLRPRPAVGDGRNLRSRAAIDFSPFLTVKQQKQKRTDISNIQRNKISISKQFFEKKTPQQLQQSDFHSTCLYYLL